MTTRMLVRELEAPNDLAAEQLSEARAALQRSNIFVLRKLQVEHDGQSLVMRGRVESYYHKQLAQELVRAAVDQVEVINALVVVYMPKTDYLFESR